ncbi:flagellar basal body rod protein FlgB [Acetobacter conturbans]|uniref:Flagellar biosynthesis protein FlgB n=1 Tax=Acetobacter conturbans TaxID=1737472 RepID=A0ABX0K0V1_9PROT|nr:flagellar basal body protein [Acetobacter conturbans]NHN89216.1 flagellar biosynthesis protein FlgB [Acetobacter conturbans]
MINASRPAAGGVDLFDLAQRRLSWLNRREEVVASNIANADTPHYVAQDIESFDSAMTQASAELSTTSEKHIALGSKGRRHVDDPSGEQSLDGNGVSLETQMQLVAETNDQQRLATNVYSAYRSMLTTVLGK